MKKTKYALEDQKKEQKSAATNFPTNSAMTPPAFNLATNQSASKVNGKDSSISALPKKNKNAAPQKVSTKKTTKKSTNQNNQNEQEASQNLGTVSSDYFLEAFENAHETFKLASILSGININGPMASSSPGCLSGPSLKNLIRNDPELMMRYHSDVDEKLIHIASGVISEGFNLWKDMFRVPGLMWYPQFAYVPGPMGIPSPNIPTMMTECMPSGLGAMKHSNLKNMMKNYLTGDDRNDHNIQILESIADKVSFKFYIWTQSTAIQGIIGQGHVPGFRPPFSFGGPVMNGYTLPRRPFI